MLALLDLLPFFGLRSSLYLLTLLLATMLLRPPIFVGLLNLLRLLSGWLVLRGFVALLGLLDSLILLCLVC